MKYLTYFRPNRELSDLILKQDNIVLPGSGLHSTLCVFRMAPDKEPALISDLSKVRFDPFEVATKEFTDFDDDCLVLKISLSDELLRLHKSIVSFVRKYADEGFEEVRQRYFGDKYNPHLTISTPSSGFDRNSRELIGRTDTITKFYLARKLDEKWEERIAFYSSADVR